MASIGKPLVRAGLDDIPTDNGFVTLLAPEERHRPDYITRGRYIEVQGCYSAEQGWGFKLEKLQALLFWHNIMPVWFLLWIQETDTIVVADFNAVLTAINDPRAIDEEYDGFKAVKRVPLELLTEPNEVVNAFEAAKSLSAVELAA